MLILLIISIFLDGLNASNRIVRQGGPPPPGNGGTLLTLKN
jgi:hypothetical protein